MEEQEVKAQKQREQQELQIKENFRLELERKKIEQRQQQTVSNCRGSEVNPFFVIQKQKFSAASDSVKDNLGGLSNQNQSMDGLGVTESSDFDMMVSISIRINIIVGIVGICSIKCILYFGGCYL